ncbi:MAG: hypothetical protein K6A43_01905 [Treponema sp.]|nr:hypothetical protein [Treponema sp.]
MKKISALLGSVLLLLALTACSGISAPKTDSAEKTDKARVSFSVGYRTLNPNQLWQSDITQVVLEYCVDSETAKPSEKTWNATEEYNAIIIMQNDEDKIELDPGIYNFTLKLYTNTDVSNEHLTQTASLQKVELKPGDNNLEFNCSWAESGDLKLTFEWKNDSEIANPHLNSIYEIAAALYTYESNGKTALPLENAAEEQDYEFLTTIEKDDEEEGLRIAEFTYKDLPAGKYFVKYWLFNQKGETLTEKPFSELLKINGYKTESVIYFDSTELNFYYQVNYILDGAKIEGRSDNNGIVTDTVNNCETYKLRTPSSKTKVVDGVTYEFEGWAETDADGKYVGYDPEVSGWDPAFYTELNPGENTNWYVKPWWKKIPNEISGTEVNLDDSDENIDEITIASTEVNDDSAWKLKATLPEDADTPERFYWVVDGILQTEESDTLIVYKDLLSVGDHQITVSAECGDNAYAGSIEETLSRVDEQRYAFVSTDKGLEFRINRFTTDIAFENVGFVEKESQFSLRMEYEKALNGWTGCWPFVSDGEDYTFSLNGAYGDADENWYNPVELPSIRYTGSKKSAFTENTKAMFNVYADQVVSARDLANADDGSVGISVTFEQDGTDLANLFADIDGVETTKSKLIISVIKPSGEWIMSTNYSENNKIPAKLTDYDFVSVLDENDWSRNCLLDQIKTGDEYIVCVSAAYYFDGNTDVCFELPLIKSEVITRK